MNTRKFYGCYQTNYEKLYIWQCKKFQTEEEASNYSIQKSNTNGKLL